MFILILIGQHVQVMFPEQCKAAVDGVVSQTVSEVVSDTKNHFERTNQLDTHLATSHDDITQVRISQ